MDGRAEAKRVLNAHTPTPAAAGPTAARTEAVLYPACSQPGCGHSDGSHTDPMYVAMTPED